MKEGRRNGSLLHVLRTRDSSEQGRGILKECMLIENKFKSAVNVFTLVLNYMVAL